MDKFMIWVALVAIAAFKIVGVLTLFLGITGGLVWVGENFSPTAVVIGIFVLGVALVIWAETMSLHDKWKRGKIHFKWEKK